MKCLLRVSYAAVSHTAADIVAALIRRKPDAVLGLATGSSPEGLYAELIRRHREEGLDFSRLTTFNLDEYIGLHPSDPECYRWFMNDRLFQHVNIDLRKTHLPDGLCRNWHQHCVDYEAMIADAGGMDLLVLGIGRNGHLGFNEPVVSSFSSRTRPVMLTQSTRLANARCFGGQLDRVPRAAISMGLSTIAEARACLVLATGNSKAKAVYAAIEGPQSAMVPASILQRHPNTTVILDEDAAFLLELSDFYKEVEEAEAEWEQSLAATT